MLDFIIFCLYIAVLIPLFLTFVRNIRYANSTSVVPRSNWRSSVIISVGGIAFLYIIQKTLSLYTDVLWFEEVKFTSVFWTVYTAKWIIYGTSAVIIFLFLWFITSGASGIAEPLPNIYFGKWVQYTKFVKLVRLLGIIIVSLLLAEIPMESWDKILLYLNHVTLHETDPILNTDISFYLFSYPLFSDVIGWALQLSILGFIALIILYGFYYIRANDRGIIDLSGSSPHPGNIPIKRIDYAKRIIRNVSLMSLIFLIIAFFSSWLAIYSVMYSTRGAVFGAGYTDVHGQIGAYKIFMGLTVAAIILVIVGAIKKNLKISLLTWAGWFVSWLVVVIAYPLLFIQTFVVNPSELDKELPFIKNNIKFTRQAYGLAKVEEKELAVSDSLTLADLQQNKGTLDNIRLWDWRALKLSYMQKQEIRLYYAFMGIDIDRYMINGKYREVMLSAREMVPDALVEQSRTWVNEKLKYTHGYGLCLNEVSQFEPNGDPKLIVKDFPPVSSAPEVNVTRPEIYYGENTNDHVYTNTTTPEFDYPRGDDNVECTYSGTGGVPIGSYFRKLAFALRFDGIKVLLSEYLKPESRVMYHRQILNRLRTIAPFLTYDRDPYMVINQGKLYWLCDAYTTSKYYPYSEPHSGINYIRNSVKAVVDAYNGNVAFYIFDSTDVIIKSWQKVFPSLFQPRSAMPAGLLAHVRYPEDMMAIQSEVYGTYHMTDPKVFYNREDVWVKANEVFSDNPQPIMPYYVMLNLPGNSQAEFMLELTFTPKTKRNMIGWMAALCDSTNYGKLLIYKMSKDKFVLGPELVEAKIDQNGEMSSQLTLWKQKGSDVIRGNTLIIPVKNSMLYVEPIYLKAENSPMPQLQKVVVAFADRVVWADDFQTALSKVFNTGTLEIPKINMTAETKSSSKAVDNKQLLNDAQYQYHQYQKLMGEGQYQQAGKALEELGKILNQIK